MSMIVIKNKKGGGVFENITNTYTAGEAISGSVLNPQAVYFDQSDSKVYLADKNTGYFGITTQSVAANADVDVIEKGVVDVDSFEKWERYKTGIFIEERTEKPSTWTDGRTVFSGTAALGDTIYTIGGATNGIEKFSCAFYSTKTDSRTSMVNNAGYTTQGGAYGYEEGEKVYYLGGYNPSGGYNKMQSFNKEYNPDTGLWTDRAGRPSESRYFSVSGLGHKMFVINGLNNNGYEIGASYIYNIKTNSWSLIPVPSAYSRGLASSCRGNIHYMCGTNKNNVNVSTHFQYNESTNTRTSKANAPITGGGLCGGEIGGFIYLFNGTNTYQYNPDTNSRTTKESQPTNIYEISGGAVADNKFYLFFGYNKKTYEYEPGNDGTKGDIGIHFSGDVVGQAVSSDKFLLSN